MMMFTTLLIVGLSVNFIPGFAQKPCCMPDQYVIQSETLLGSLSSAWSGMLTINETKDSAYDYKNNRVGEFVLRKFLPQPDPDQVFRRVQDLKSNTQWVITGENCVKTTPIPPEYLPMQCVPPNSTYAGNYYVADKRAYADKWRYTDPQFDFHISVVTKDNCAPLSNTYVGTIFAEGLTQQMVLTGTYSNFELGVKDPDRYFNLPDSCKK